ncbi:hypothetical protein CHS0354_025206 [Potamilus streckersoni]|uniref:Uncharacterized protein n=1 Tax=Potamilus streckersoni TaxID=2493646 RepID=A0AAE0RN23_9BIVA|nr:hypothetical protein CHS0354_025206 [Potamilus streckersoni]
MIYFYKRKFADETYIDSDGSSEHDNDQKGYEDESQGSEGAGERTDSNSDDDNVTTEQGILKMINEDGETYQPKGSLTTTLMSREGEERKRQRKTKDKKRKLRKIGKNKLKYKIGKVMEERDGDQEREDTESSSFDSDNEGRRIDGAVIAPFTRQYKYKKQIEHILNEEHNLTEEDHNDKINNLNELDTLSTSAATCHPTSEEEVICPDSIVKTPGSDTDGDSAVSHVEDATKKDFDVDDIVKGNEKHVGTDRADKEERKGDNDKTGAHQVIFMDKTQIHQVPDNKNITNPSIKGLTLIHVKELKQGKMSVKKSFEAEEDSTESISTETDSGVEDEDHVYIDVQLTQDQQDFIYKSLHDEHNNLRPAFERNEEGKIIRKSDGTIVFDPHTGKVRIRKQIGNLFSIPRLKRNKKGRLIGGYHDDQFGPTKQNEAEADLIALDSSISTNSISDKRSWSSKRNSSAQSAHKLKKEDSTRTKSVAFGIRDELEVVQTDNSESSELRMKGRRDITSAIRKKLRDRLFRRRKKRGVEQPKELFMNRKPKKAWVQFNSSTGQEKIENGEGHGIGSKNIQLTQLVRMQEKASPQWSLDTPVGFQGRHITVPYNRSVARGSMDQKYQRIFQQGLETDRKVLHRLNEKTLDKRKSGLYISNDVIYNADGEMKEEINKNGHIGDRGSDNSLLEEGDNGIQSPIFSRRGLNSTRLYDDYRLRILLEELFRDKKYFDHFIKTTDPNSDVLMQTKGIAELGREFLLERADFWEARGPIPPRPPLTRYGFYMSRAHTSLQEDVNSTSTITPIPRSHTMPVNLPGYLIRDKQSSNDNIQETEIGGKNEH